MAPIELPFSPTIGPALSLDRMSVKRGDEAWVITERQREDARFLLLVDLSPAILSNNDRTEARIRWFSLQELTSLDLTEKTAFFLGCDKKNIPHFAVAIDMDDAGTLPFGPDYLKPIVDLRSLALQGVISPDELSLIGQARALSSWHKDHRCCGRCGARTKIKDGGWRRKCWACARSIFPRSDPAVIMLITDGTRCLLGHERRFPEKFMSVLAGFVEPGETIEDAVRREVREEAGIEVGHVQYVASQPWPFPHSLMIGCVGKALTTELELKDSELLAAGWFTREEAKQMLAAKHAEELTVPAKISISNALIQSFADGLI